MTYLNGLPRALARRYQKNGMLQLYQQLVNTGFPSLICYWKKVQCHKLMEDNETADLQIKFQRSGLFSWVTLKVRIFRLSVSEQSTKLKTKQCLHIMLML